MPPRPLAPLSGFRRSARASVVLVLLALATVHPASGTTLRMLGLDDLAQGATDIVVARVESVQPRWTRDHRSIVTEVRLKVEERLKGDEAPTLTVVTPGGELDGIRVEVDAVPAFVVGERCVLFTSRNAAGRTAVLGLAQGKFEVTESDRTGEVLVRRSTPGFERFGFGSNAQTPPTHGGGFVHQALPEFLTAVRAQLRGVNR